MFGKVVFEVFVGCRLDAPEVWSRKRTSQPQVNAITAIDVGELALATWSYRGIGDGIGFLPTDLVFEELRSLRFARKTPRSFKSTMMILHTEL
jgi:hypothetical protein